LLWTVVALGVLGEIMVVADVVAFCAKSFVFVSQFIVLFSHPYIHLLFTAIFTSSLDIAVKPHIHGYQAILGND
jgi:hypothetical protein